MSKNSKAEVIAAVRERYWKAKKTQKSQILDEPVATTGYNRKYAINLLRHEKHGLSTTKLGSLLKKPNPSAHLYALGRGTRRLYGG